jgi:hypothetical protein
MLFHNRERVRGIACEKRCKRYESMRESMRERAHKQLFD